MTTSTFKLPHPYKFIQNISEFNQYYIEHIWKTFLDHAQQQDIILIEKILFIDMKIGSESENIGDAILNSLPIEFTQQFFLNKTTQNVPITIRNILDVNKTPKNINNSSTFIGQLFNKWDGHNSARIYDITNNSRAFHNVERKRIIDGFTGGFQTSKEKMNDVLQEVLSEHIESPQILSPIHKKKNANPDSIRKIFNRIYNYIITGDIMSDEYIEYAEEYVICSDNIKIISRFCDTLIKIMNIDAIFNYEPFRFLYQINFTARETTWLTNNKPSNFNFPANTLYGAIISIIMSLQYYCVDFVFSQFTDHISTLKFQECESDLYYGEFIQIYENITPLIQSTTYIINTVIQNKLSHMTKHECILKEIMSERILNYDTFDDILFLSNSIHSRAIMFPFFQRVSFFPELLEIISRKNAIPVEHITDSTWLFANVDFIIAEIERLIYIPLNILHKTILNKPSELTTIINRLTLDSTKNYSRYEIFNQMRELIQYNGDCFATINKKTYYLNEITIKISQEILMKREIHNEINDLIFFVDLCDFLMNDILQYIIYMKQNHFIYDDMENFWEIIGIFKIQEDKTHSTSKLLYKIFMQNENLDDNPEIINNTFDCRNINTYDFLAKCIFKIQNTNYREIQKKLCKLICTYPQLVDFIFGFLTPQNIIDFRKRIGKICKNIEFYISVSDLFNKIHVNYPIRMWELLKEFETQSNSYSIYVIANIFYMMGKLICNYNDYMNELLCDYGAYTDIKDICSSCDLSGNHIIIRKGDADDRKYLHHNMQSESILFGEIIRNVRKPIKKLQHEMRIFKQSKYALSGKFTKRGNIINMCKILFSSM